MFAEFIPLRVFEPFDKIKAILITGVNIQLSLII